MLAPNGYAYLFPQRDVADDSILQLSSGTYVPPPANNTGRVPRLDLSGTRPSYRRAKLVLQFSSLLRRGRVCQRLGCRPQRLRQHLARGRWRPPPHRLRQSLPPHRRPGHSRPVGWRPHRPSPCCNGPITPPPAIPPPSSPARSAPGASEDTHLQLFHDDDLGFASSLDLPQIPAAQNLADGHGRFTFWEKERHRPGHRAAGPNPPPTCPRPLPSPFWRRLPTLPVPSRWALIPPQPSQYRRHRHRHRHRARRLQLGRRLRCRLAGHHRRRGLGAATAVSVTPSPPIPPPPPAPPSSPSLIFLHGAGPHRLRGPVRSHRHLRGCLPAPRQLLHHGRRWLSLVRFPVQRPAHHHRRHPRHARTVTFLLPPIPPASSARPIS